MTPTVPSRFILEEDFGAGSAATLPSPWTTQDTSAAGTPTLAYVANAINGEFQLAHSSTSESQRLTLYWGDQLMIDPTKKPIIRMRLRLNFAGSTFSADQRAVWGLASARNATLDSVVSNLWFRNEGANLNILWESDDGTTDDDDNDTGIDLPSDKGYVWYEIDARNLSAVEFKVDGAVVGTASVPLLTASNKLQPFVEIQRDASTETEVLIVDYISVEQDR